MNTVTWVQIISVILSVLSLLGVGIIASQFWNKHFEKQKNKEEEQSKEHQLSQKIDRQSEIREVIASEIKPIIETLADVQKSVSLANEGTLASLRNDLLNVYYQCRTKGYKTRNDAENFRDLYKAYTALNGNSFIEHDILPAFDQLKLSEDVEYQNKKGNL